jgi:hypothetical protein
VSSAGRDLSQRHQVSQAQGMVSIQAHCAFREALALMKERAKLTGQTLDGVVDGVLARKVWFG